MELTLEVGAGLGWAGLGVLGWAGRLVCCCRGLPGRAGCLLQSVNVGSGVCV